MLRGKLGRHTYNTNNRQGNGECLTRKKLVHSVLTFCIEVLFEMWVSKYANGQTECRQNNKHAVGCNR